MEGLPSLMHNITEWQIKLSFKFDVLCFLNTLALDINKLDEVGGKEFRDKA